MTNALRLSVFLAVVAALGLPALSASGKPKPPAPPPDSADDCTFVAEASVPDYLVLAAIDVGVGVRCATTKRTISVSATLTRDGVVVPILPLGADTPTCTNTSACLVSFDLFSLDNFPVPSPGNQRYCASGSGAVGGRTLGPQAACEEDERI